MHWIIQLKYWISICIELFIFYHFGSGGKKSEIKEYYLLLLPKHGFFLFTFHDNKIHFSTVKYILCLQFQTTQ